MKPTVNMDQKIVPPEVAMPQSEVKKPVLSRRMIGVILGVTMISLVAVGALAGVFVGKSMTKGIYKEAWVTFQLKDSKEVVKERLIVEDKEVYIRKPGEMGLIYDYDKNKVTMQIDSVYDNTTGDCECIVFDFDPLSEMSLQQTIDYLNQTYLIQRETAMRDDLRLSYTERRFDVESLSKRSQEMCLGCKIYEVDTSVTEDKQDHTQKRNHCDWRIIRWCYFTYCRSYLICRRITFL